MKQLFSIAAVFVVLTFGTFAFAQENPRGSNAKAFFEKYVQLGPGVYNIKIDEETGKIQSLIVVGAAPICTQLSAMKIDNAQREASIHCAAQFARWFAGSKFEYSTEVIVDKDGRSHSKEHIVDEDLAPYEVQRYIMSLFLENAETVYWKVDSENEEYVIVKYLNMKKLDAAKRAIQILTGKPAARRE